PTTVVSIAVQAPTTAGTISADQTICQGTVPASFISDISGSGSGVLSYRWEQSANSSNGFTIIVGADQASYSSAALTATTYFRRVTISTENGVACESIPTSAVTITVQDAAIAGTISADQTICNNTAPAALTSA